jgi:hypothetical protein
MFMHLVAYGKNIHVEIFWNDAENAPHPELVFTSYGRAKYFKKINYLVSKAPVMPGWTFTSLQPPVPIDYFMEEDYGHLNIDYFNCWFKPPELLSSEGKYYLDVYAEIYTDITDEHETAIRAAVWNVLGEKVYASELRHIDVNSLFDLTKKQRSALINLQQLPGYIKDRDPSCYVINDKGIMMQQKY